MGKQRNKLLQIFTDHIVKGTDQLIITALKVALESTF